jgi:hypothetical protein
MSKSVELADALKSAPFFYEKGAVFEQKTDLGLVKIFAGTEREIIGLLENWWAINASYDDVDKSTAAALAEARDYQMRTKWQDARIEALTDELAVLNRAYDAADELYDALKAEDRMLRDGIAEAVKILAPEDAAHVG